MVAVVMRNALNLFSYPTHHVLVDILSMVSLGMVLIGAMFQNVIFYVAGFYL